MSQPTDEIALPSLPVAAIKALRIKQWAKNGLLFAALLFSGKFTSPPEIIDALLGFVAFSFAASAGYIFNDALDREADRKHPKKRHRPIASGALPVPVAIVELVIVGGLGLGLAWFINPWFFAITVAYLVETLTYSFFLKHVVIIDVMMIASGFVLRAIAGALAIGVAVSPWFFLCTAFLALFIGFNKRRAELASLGEGSGTRKNLDQYSASLLREFQAIVTANVVVTYSLYTIMGSHPWMVVTIPYVLYIVFRYIYLVEMKGAGGAPEDTLLGDAPILLTTALYVLTVMAILLLTQPVAA
ncbi:MAG: decaprenyl-phosphate phosphoribosyltransferase [Proteobacteria bacterium]|nr:decaprenyl-phosphate phosphoribosyltransferase [Pseudomonadota bacterium]